MLTGIRLLLRLALRPEVPEAAPEGFEVAPLQLLAEVDEEVPVKEEVPGGALDSHSGESKNSPGLMECRNWPAHMTLILSCENV